MEPTTTEAVGRQWVVVFNPTNGFVARDQQSLTRYGWLMLALEESGAQFASQFLTSLRNGPWVVPYTYHTMMTADPKPSLNYWFTEAATVPARMGVIGGLSGARPYTPDYLAFSFADQFYRSPSGGSPSAEQRAQFKIVWEAAGIVPSGTRLRSSPDTHPILTVTESRVEVRIPCELAAPGQDAASAARGRLVVVSDDSGLLGELKQLRAEANPDGGTGSPPADLARRNFKWRLVGLESDMVKVQMQRPGEPGGAPPPPSPAPTP
jgi:hypothetical protein